MDIVRNGQELHSFFPDISVRLSSTWVVPNYVVSQLLTGHGCFRALLRRMTLCDSTSCPCGEPSKSRDHVLWECKLYTEPRNTLLNSLERAAFDPAHVLTLVASPGNFNRFQLRLRNLLPSPNNKLKLECVFNTPIPENYSVRCFYKTEESVIWFPLPANIIPNKEALGIKSVTIVTDKTRADREMTVTCGLYDDSDLHVTDSNYLTVLLIVKPDNSTTTPGPLAKTEPTAADDISVEPVINTTAGPLAKTEPTVADVTSVKPVINTTAGPLAKTEPTDSPLPVAWICVGVAIFIILLIVIAILTYIIQRKRNVTPNVNDNNDVSLEPVYSYATAPVLKWEDAHALAANNRPLPRYESVVPSLPPRNANQPEYEYIDPRDLRK
ncbi:uncharacterized protein LOC113232137 [Hyposmocoma kahamanoa]|uniref:uncharacterized protein LOC113232137 n=1 Tax=Hyposmocoma kahamanoa TaxID=1477025 RepID=UPI000E6D7004|nr:uncharacterized protein LOC113232137 [Hyposmocoma kahamanoa]